MAATTLSNVNFLSQAFRDTLGGEFTHKLELYNSVLMNANGYIVPDRGYTQAIPKWATLLSAGFSDQITEGGTTTINALADFKDVGVWVEREKAWGANQLLMTVSPDKDVTREVARQIAEYWAGDFHNTAVNVANGVFAAASMTTHVFDDSGNTINVGGLNGAKLKLGDNLDLLTSIVMHSKVYTDAVNDKVLTYDKAQVDTYGTGAIAQILGMRPYVTDSLAATAGVYPSFLGRMGSMIYVSRPRPAAQWNNQNRFLIAAQGVTIEIELNREAKASGGQDEVISRCSYLVHVPGVAWQTSPVASNPTNTQLATGTNWVKVVTDDKLIKLIQYKSA